MAQIKYPLTYSLGVAVQDFPKVQYTKITEMIDAINAIQSGNITLTTVDAGDGTVALPAFTFTSDLTSGIYKISTGNYGFSITGAKVLNISASGLDVTGAITATTSISATTSLLATTTVTATTGLITNSITELTSGKGITLSKNIIRKTTLAALNSTGTITAAMINNGGISSTSVAGVTATIDSIANLVTQLGAVAGTFVDFVVDNTPGASTVTVALPSGMVVAKQTSSGDTAVDQLLTVAASSTIGAGMFRIYFQSTSAAIIYRIS